MTVIVGCLWVRTFGNFLAPALATAHTVNNLDPGHKNERYESEIIPQNWQIKNQKSHTLR